MADKKLKEVLERQISLIRLTEKEREKIEKEASEFIKKLNSKIKNKKIKADIFIGGSLAKETLIKKNKYDIDIFVRFDKKYKEEELSQMLSKVMDNAEKIHGSRDYFQIEKGEIVFEIIPVVKIAKPKEARNVTDLSFFHVSYIRGKIKENKKLADEIMLAKSFAHAQRCYGAESYIDGFSGYALELLVSYYGSFLKFINDIKDKNKIIIDPEKFYKNKNEILLELNESKLQSPIVFVDPTFKERNALAALSKETFEKFKQGCIKFLNNPSEGAFNKQNIEQELRKENKNLVIIEASTQRQKGDIAGSKLKKFSRYLGKSLDKNFEVKQMEFEYNSSENKCRIYLVLNQRKQIILEGPPASSAENLEKFRKKHPNCKIKSGKAYATEKPLSIKEFIEQLKNDKTPKEMGITGIKLI